ncbi:serine/threonine receptor-like kinase NFP [Pistacia vera]|uniref:serine/threonine receptor-like kinase NFP n=1 Tax=Pistacia vera TaxID=55513 RepID=UPI001263B1F3|nr:serine/threonine receptor-like kinase NFP [Pistacia vera]
MRIKLRYLSSSFLLLFFLCYVQSQEFLPNTTGYTCSPNQTTNQCQTYAFYRASAPSYRASAPNLLDLASIGDLFSVSRLMISNPSNISSPSSPLIQNQPLFVPLTCSCNTLNTSYSISFANLSYTIVQGDTFYLVSTYLYLNLTTYQSVMIVNPTVVPTELEAGDVVQFPIFCKCPNETQLQNQVSYLVSYVLQPSDNLSSVASMFGIETQSIIDVNGNNSQTFETIFVPVARLPQLPQLTQPDAVTPASPGAGKTERKGVNTGLAIGLAICGVLLVLVTGMLIYSEVILKKRRKRKSDDAEKQKLQFDKGGKGFKNMEVNLMADVSDCLDKYKLFNIEELREATNDFSEDCLIQGSVYKGFINGEVYAIKMMKWNACEELKILQKVNHGNLVKLEGFCIDPEDANCYLIYEYVENGSLHSWLHENKNKKLNWKTRLRIAVDVANGLQYIHEHTRPRVVHKDIKSSNVLLDSNMRAKIANFGLAKSGCNAITMHIVGTQGYMAPEYLTDGVVSTKMDVFSFGVVLLELLSGKEAVDDEGRALWTSVGGILEGNEESKVKRMKEWMDVVFLQDTCSMESLMSVTDIAIACVHRDPSKRPSMVDIVYALCKSDDLFFDISEDGLDPQVNAR